MEVLELLEVLEVLEVSGLGEEGGDYSGDLWVPGRV